MSFWCGTLLPDLGLPPSLIKSTIEDIIRSSSSRRKESSTEESSSESSSEEDSSSDEASIESLRNDIKKTRRKMKEVKQRLEERPIVRTARHAPSLRLQGNNIGVLGQTSTGKSTLINTFLARNVAATGPGETTTQITRYPGRRNTLWDIPGRNDVVSYEREEYISLFKELTHRLILIQSSVKENRDLMRLFDDLHLVYNIVVNKYDLVDDNEREDFKRQIKSEIRSLNLKQMPRVFFISAKNPNRFPDWLKMFDHLTK